MKVVVTESATNHLLAIRDYIAQDSPHYAQRMVDRILKRTDILTRFPRFGAVVPEYETEEIRELQEKSYRIIYKVLPDRIDILAVIHGARQMPADVKDLTD